MSEKRSDMESVVASDGAVAKRPWSAPDLQEVDVFDTEAGAGLYDPGDLATYTS